MREGGGEVRGIRGKKLWWYSDTKKCLKTLREFKIKGPLLVLIIKCLPLHWMERKKELGVDTWWLQQYLLVLSNKETLHSVAPRTKNSTKTKRIVRLSQPKHHKRSIMFSKLSKHHYHLSTRGMSARRVQKLGQNMLKFRPPDQFHFMVRKGPS